MLSWEVWMDIKQLLKAKSLFIRSGTENLLSICRTNDFLAVAPAQATGLRSKIRPPGGSILDEK